MLLNWTPFNFGINILIIFGLWKLNTNNAVKVRVYSSYQKFMWIVFMALFNISQLADFYMVMFDLEKISINCRGTLITSMSLFASLDMISHFRHISDLKRAFDEDDENNKDVEEIYSRARREMKTVNRFFSFSIYFSLTWWLLAPLLDKNPEGRKLPFRQWIPFDLKALSNYYVVYVIQVVSSYYVRSFVLGSGSLALGFFIRITAKYEILERKIKIINQICCFKSNGLIWKYVKERRMSKLIKEIVADHQEILL